MGRQIWKTGSWTVRGAMPLDAESLRTEARARWLTNVEVYTLLRHCHDFGFKTSLVVPECPASGTVMLYNKLCVKRFRQDGHNWVKRKNGISVKESHEKLRINGEYVLTCCYTRGEDQPKFQRRLYWLLDPGSNTVLVHYLNTTETKALVPLPCATLPCASYPQPPTAAVTEVQEPMEQLSVTREWNADELVGVLDSAPEFVLPGESCKIIMVLTQAVNERGPLYCAFGDQKVKVNLLHSNTVSCQSPCFETFGQVYYRLLNSAGDPISNLACIDVLDGSPWAIAKDVHAEPCY